MDHPADHTDARLTSLEEHTAYAERTVEHLSLEIAELNKRVHALTTRTTALEDKLRALLQSPKPELSDEADGPTAADS